MLTDYCVFRRPTMRADELETETAFHRGFRADDREIGPYNLGSLNAQHVRLNRDPGNVCCRCSTCPPYTSA